MTGHRSHTASDAGFTLVELVLASVIALMLAGAVLGFVSQTSRLFRVQPDLSDQQQRLRISVDTLRHDLLMAGAGLDTGPATGPLNGYIAPVLPYRAFGDSADPNRGTFFRQDTISVLYVDSTPAQSTLAAPLSPGSLDARITAMPNCPPASATQMCGFEAGARVVVLGEGGQWDIFNIDHIDAGVAALLHRGATPRGYLTGDAVAAVKLATYYLRTDSTGASQLFRYDGWASESPVVDDIVALKFDYFGDPRPPMRTQALIGSEPGPWTTYGPTPPAIGTVQGTWPAGENCVFVVVDGAHTARLAAVSGLGSPLVALTSAELTDGPWCPDDTASNRFDADLLRIRRIRVTMRIRSTLASSRGPAGALLVARGTTPAGVPDLQVQFDVSPRNLALEP